jgi:LacI family transcriptional regulator
MSTRNEVTIYDIAKVLDLSTSTVSRALNGSTSVNHQTRSKIAEAASALGYRRNLFASRLRSGNSKLLGVLVTRLNTTISSCVLSGVETASSQMSYGIVVNQSMNQPELRLRSIENLERHSVDGILVMSSYYQEYSSLDQLGKMRLPTVVVDASSFLPSRPKRQISDFENAFELTSHLIEKGCRRIAYFSADIDKARQSKLLSGCQEAMNVHKAEEQNFILASHDTQHSWPDIRPILLSMQPEPDGIIFSNDTITAIAYSTSAFSTTGGKEYWLTCRKGDIASQNQRLVELGKIAGSFLICLSERNNNSTGMSGNEWSGGKHESNYEREAE